jgi:hypothetical protein
VWSSIRDIGPGDGGARDQTVVYFSTQMGLRAPAVTRSTVEEFAHLVMRLFLGE